MAIAAVAVGTLVSPVASPAVAGPPSPTTITLSASSATFDAGGSVTLTAATDQPVDGLGSISIVDQTTSATVASCSSGSSCVTEVSFNTGGPHSYIAEFGSLASDPVTVARAAWTVALDATSSTVAAGVAPHLDATANQDVGETGGHYEIDIFDLTEGTRIVACTTGAECSVDAPDLYVAGDATHLYEAMVAETGTPDTPGEAGDVQVASDPVEVDRAPWSATISITPPSASAGDTVNVSAMTDQDVGVTHGRVVTYLVDVVDGAIVQTCATGTTCSANYTWRADTPALVFVVFVAAPGATSLSSLTGVLTTASQGVDVTPWGASIATDKTVLAAGDSNTITATTNQDLSETAGLALYILESTNDHVVAVCTTGTICTTTDHFYKPTDDNYADHSYSAVVAPYDTSATSWETLPSDIRASSSSIEVDPLPWTVAMRMTGNSGSHYQFTIRTNQDVGKTGGKLQMTLFNSDTSTSEASCTSGKVCILNSTGKSQTGYFVYVGQRPTPTNADDDSDVHAGDGISWAPPAVGTVAELGPGLPGEIYGGVNLSEKNCGCSHADPVAAATGEYYESVSDLSLAGAGPAVESSRSYSSDDLVDGPFGFGWASGWGGANVQVTIPSDDSSPLPRQVQVTQENGSQLVFTRDDSGDFIPLTRVMATLTWSNVTSSWTFTRERSDRLTFDGEGQLTSVADLNGDTVELAYNADGTLHQISGSGGRVITLAWTSGHVTGEEDSASRSVSFVYDAAGDLTSVTDPTGATTSYGYDSSHRMTSLTNALGGETDTVYDGSGRVQSQTDPLHRTTAFSYNGDGTDGNVVTTITDPNGVKTVETYVLGLMVSEAHAVGTPLASTTTFTFDESANLISTTDPLGATTSYTYDSNGNQLTVTDPLGHVTTKTYDSHNDLLTSTDPLARESSSTFDDAGNQTSATTPAGHESTASYNSDGTVASSTDARGKTTTYAYDAAGRLTSRVDPLNRTQSTGYDSAGFVTSTTDGAGKTTALTVDALGRTLTSTDPDGETTTTAYDGDGNVVSTTDPAGKVTTNAYDHANQKVSTTDPLGHVTAYTYTATGKVETVTDANGHVTSDAYDALDRLISSTDPLNRTTHYAYDLDGHPTGTTLPSGAASSSTYDLAGNKTSDTDARGKTTTYAYDNANQLTSSTDPLGRTTSTSYTADGKVHVVTLPDASTQTYAYDDDDMVTSFTNPDAAVTSYGYDDAEELASVTQPGLSTETFDYDSAGRIHVDHRADGSTVTTSYDGEGRSTRLHYSESGSIDTTFTYDVDGRRTGMTDDTGTTTSTWDDAGRLTSSTDGAGATVAFTYDAVGNKLTVTYPSAEAVSYTYDNADEMTAVTDWSSRTSTFTWTSDGRDC